MYLLVAMALLAGPSIRAEEPKQEPAKAADSSSPEKQEQTPARKSADKAEADKGKAGKKSKSKIERPSEDAADGTKRVGAFWFITIGK